MAALSELPTEILIHIFSFLSVPDFMSVSKVCRSFCEVVRKYGDIKNRKKYRWIRFHSQNDIYKASALLMSILRDPHLGHYVRGVDMMYPDQYCGGLRTMETLLSVDDCCQLKSLVHAAGFLAHEQDQMMQVFSSPGVQGKRKSFLVHSLTALIVSVSPHLENLAVPNIFLCPPIASEAGEDGFESPLALLLRRANQQNAPPHIRHLQRVHLIMVEIAQSYNRLYYRRTDSLSGMHPIDHNVEIAENVSSDLMNEGDHIPHASTWRPVIRIVSGPNDTLYQTLLICEVSGLDELQFALGDRTVLDGGIPNVNPRALFQALLGIKGAVEVLEVVLEGDDRCFDSYGVGVGREDAWCAPPPLLPENPDLDGVRQILPNALFWERKGSLKDFTALKRLNIGIHLLWLFSIGTEYPQREVHLKNFSLLDSLPPNLEHLSIRGYAKGESERLDELIQELLTDKHRKLPSLKTLEGVNGVKGID